MVCVYLKQEDSNEWNEAEIDRIPLSRQEMERIRNSPGLKSLLSKEEGGNVRRIERAAKRAILKATTTGLFGLLSV